MVGIDDDEGCVGEGLVFDLGVYDGVVFCGVGVDDDEEVGGVDVCEVVGGGVGVEDEFEFCGVGGVVDVCVVVYVVGVEGYLS